MNPLFISKLLIVFTTLILYSCGVKGPPLPPVPTSAELSEQLPKPTPTPTKDQ